MRAFSMPTISSVASETPAAPYAGGEALLQFFLGHIVEIRA
jgi:hypothetical protein